MLKNIALTLSLMSFLSSGIINAQAIMPKIYYIKNDVSVVANNVPQKSAWSGGVNNPQFSLADLNKDGKKDLVIYEREIGVRTFINSGVNGNPNYIYDGNYEYTFPTEIRGYLRLIDYNRDNIPDLFHKGNTGFSVYKGYYNSNNHLAFTFYQELFYYKWNGWINAYVDPNDLPAIIDIDNDGDLDFLSYNMSGNRIGYYRNCQKEESLPNDSIKICYADECWGKFYQNIERTMALDKSCDNSGTSCKGCPPPGSGNKTTHQGNTLCIFDYDGDGDYDLLNGNISYSDIQLLINGKNNTPSLVDTMISQDTSWSAHGHKMFMDMFPAAFSIDIDQDDDEDLLFAPNAAGYENYNSIAYYKNTGTKNSPNYVFQSNSFIVDDMIDVGS